MEGEPVAAAERVGPGDVTVEPHLHERGSDERHPVHVEIAGNGQVAFPEPAVASPWEVRVRDNEAAAAGRDGPTERPTVRSRMIRRDDGLVCGRVHHRCGTGRLCSADELDHVAARSHQRHIGVEHEEVERLDRRDPGSRSAPRRQRLGAVIGQPTIDTGGVADDQLDDLGWLGGEHPLGPGANPESQVPEVGVHVTIVWAPAEVAGPLAAHLHDLIGDRRQVVVSARVALPERQAAQIGRTHVRDAVGGAPDLRLVPMVPRDAVHPFTLCRGPTDDRRCPGTSNAPTPPQKRPCSAVSSFGRRERLCAGQGMSSKASPWAGRTTAKSRWFIVAMVVTPRRSAIATMQASMRSRRRSW